MGFGEVYYDSFVLSGGSETLDPLLGLLDFNFTILGQTFSIFDDANYPTSPTVDFLDFMPTAMDFLVVEDGVEILEPNVISLGVQGDLIPALNGDIICPVDTGICNEGGVYYVEAFINVAEIPEIPVPAALWLFGSGLLGLAGIARKKKAA